MYKCMHVNSMSRESCNACREYRQATHIFSTHNEKTVSRPINFEYTFLCILLHKPYVFTGILPITPYTFSCMLCGYFAGFYHRALHISVIPIIDIYHRQ